MTSRHHIASMLFFCPILLLSQPALGQFSQQGPKLVGAAALGQARQGWSVSISADGNTAIVGGPGDNNDTGGAAWIWTRTGGVWPQGTKLVGSGAEGMFGANQGYSVSLSADGNTAVVGGPGDNDFAGASWVWMRNGGVWSQQGTKLVGSGAAGNAQQGTSISLSADGNTAVVGGPLDNNNAGAAWVWTRSEGVWSQQGTKLVGSGVVGTSFQGNGVAVSGDGNTVIVGGPQDNNDAGAAWVWTRSGGVWSQQGSKLVGDGSNGALQGVSVSLSADGNTAIVGGPQDNNSTGAAWIWTRAGGTWSQQGSKLVGSNSIETQSGYGAYQGFSVSLSADGHTALVGGPQDNNFAGAAWIWTRGGETWSQQGTKLVGSGGVGMAAAGGSVCLAADGNTAFAGGNLDNHFAGAAWVFAVVPHRRRAVRH